MTGTILTLQYSRFYSLNNCVSHEGRVSLPSLTPFCMLAPDRSFETHVLRTITKIWTVLQSKYVILDHLHLVSEKAPFHF